MPRQTVRLTNITHGGSAIAGGQFWDGSSTPPASLGTTGLLAGYTFDYDQANRLTEFASWADGTGTVYGYDDRGQLTSASTTAFAGITPLYGLATAEAYDFDAGGNRTGTGGVSQSATGTHNQLQTDGEYDYFYDAEGNLIRKEAVSGWGATIYDWDHRNRLIAVKEAPFYQSQPVYENIFNLYVEYIYDAFDQRIGKRVEYATGPYGWSGPQWKRSEVFVWADGQEMLRYVDSDGLGTSQPYRLASRYLWSNQVDQLLAEEQYADGAGPAISGAPRHLIPGETLWPLTDHLGSVRDLVDNNGVNRNHVAFDSFGNRIVDQHYDTTGIAVSPTHAEAIDTLFGYTGRDWDADTELQYNRARWYDPNTGRWLSQDPIGFTAGDANLYRYVGNGPTTLTDPSGLNPNQGGSKDRDDFMGELRNWEEIFRAKHGRYPNWHEGLLLMRNVQLMPVDAGSNHYYVFGCKNKRWLDMRHVVETAIGSAAIGDARSAEIGVLVEVIQKRVLDRGPHPLGSNGAGNAASANGVEDLFSNIAGLYLAEHGRRAGFTSRLSTVMDSFFDMMDVGDVSDSCSYGSLPATEIEWQRWRLNPWVFWTMQEEEGAMVGTPFLTPFLDGATTPGDRLRSNEQALDIDDLSRQPFPVPPVPKPSGTPRRR